MKLRLQLILFLFPFFFQSSAQKAFNGDSLFFVARNSAFSNNHALALEQCDTVLAHYPDYSDVKILKARIHSWDKNYTESKAILEKVIAEKPDNMDAHKAITNNALWSKQPLEAIANAEKGLLIDPNNLELLTNKAKAQMQLGQYKEADKTLAIINQINPDNEDAADLAKEMIPLRRKNTINLFNLHDWFGSVYGQRNLLSLEYKRATDLGPVLGRINYASRFGLTGLQYEADFYPRLSKTLSGYLNYGFSSDNLLFPKHRFGAELFYSFPKKISASLGIRYLIFTNNDLLTLTGSAGIYRGLYWFGARLYVTPTKSKVGESVFLYARRFLRDEKNYITLTLGQGASPENSNNGLNFDSFYLLKSQTAKLQWVKTFGARYAFQLGTEFTRLQLPFDTQKHIFQFTLDTGIKVMF